MHRLEVRRVWRGASGAAACACPPNDAYAARWRLIQQSLIIYSHWDSVDEIAKYFNYQPILILLATINQKIFAQHLSFGKFMV